jgi:hypothetical protein
MSADTDTLLAALAFFMTLEEIATFQGTHGGRHPNQTRI